MGARFNGVQREYVLTRVAYHYLAMPGKSQAGVAAAVSEDIAGWENQKGRPPLERSTISRYLSRLRQQWMQSAVMNFDARKALELAKIDRLEWEYWEAWQRSCEDATRTTKGGDEKVIGQLKDREGKITPVTATVRKASETIEGRYGDPRFLEGVRWCIQRRIEICGLEAPKLVGLADADGQPATFAEWIKRATIQRDRSHDGRSVLQLPAPGERGLPTPLPSPPCPGVHGLLGGHSGADAEGVREGRTQRRPAVDPDHGP